MVYCRRYYGGSIIVKAAPVDHATLVWFSAGDLPVGDRVQQGFSGDDTQDLIESHQTKTEVNPIAITFSLSGSTWGRVVALHCSG